MAETFLIAWRRLDDVPEEQALPWLYGVARRVLANHRRGETRRHGHAQTFGPPAPQSRDRIYIACWLDGSPAPDFEQILRPLAYCPRCDEMIESRQAWKPGKTVGRYRQSYVYVHAACGTVVEPG